MTVRELIRELQTYPGDAIVAWRDHDQHAGEYNGVVEYVDAQDDEEDWDINHSRSESDYQREEKLRAARKVGVILSP